ncbi:unnamed protein product [Calypogeia fissa]
MQLVTMELASSIMQLRLQASAPPSLLQQQQQQKKTNLSIGAIQSATPRRSRFHDAIGSSTPSESVQRQGLRAGFVLSAAAQNNSSSVPSQQVNTNEDRPVLQSGPKLHGSSTKAKRSDSQKCQVLSSAVEAHLLTQIQADPTQVHRDRSEPEPPRNEEAEGVFQAPVENLRALLRLWDIDNDKTSNYELLAVADYLERFGLDIYFRQEVKAILDRVFRIWSENSYSKTAAILGDLQVVGLAFYLLRSHEYNVQPSIFQLYRAEDGSFCKKPVQGSGHKAPPRADVKDLVNLLRASDLKFRSDVILRDAFKFASTALTGLLDGANGAAKEPPLSQKMSEEVKYRLSYPWAINFRMLETRQSVLNTEVESVAARFSSPRLSTAVVSLMVSTATQMFNHYHSVFQQEIDDVRRWYKESGCADINPRPAMILLPFHLAFAYDMPQAKYAYSRDVCAKASYLLTAQDDLYDGPSAYTMEEILIFMDAFRKFDPSILEKIPNIQDGKYKALRTVYQAMYDLTLIWAPETSRWYGRDFLQTWIDTWMIRLEVYLNEKLWVEEKYKFTIEEYIEEYGKWSFAVETGCPICYYAVPGLVLSPSFLKNRPDLEALFAMSIAGRYLNDARSHQFEREENKSDYIKLLMEQTPGLTEEEAVQKADEMAVPAVEDTTEAILRSGIPYPEVTQILLLVFRACILMYSTVDGLRVPAWILGKLVDPLPPLITK